MNDKKCLACRGTGKMPGTSVSCGFCGGKGYHKGDGSDRRSSGPPEKQPEYQEEYKKLVSSGKIKLRED
jgi:RecJ-like exonuclease